MRAKVQPEAQEGHEGWDDYAPFYDWENARTLGKRDVPFWRNLALHCGGPCSGARLRNGSYLVAARASRRAARRHRSLEPDAQSRARTARPARTSSAARVRLIRGDIRFLPFDRRDSRWCLRPTGSCSRFCANVT